MKFKTITSAAAMAAAMWLVGGGAHAGDAGLERAEIGAEVDGYFDGDAAVPETTDQVDFGNLHRPEGEVGRDGDFDGGASGGGAS